MNKETIWKLALESGLCDPDLCSDTQLVTDYGDATKAIEKFAAMVAAAEREACAKVCEEWLAVHGDYFAERIRERSQNQ